MQKDNTQTGRIQQVKCSTEKGKKQKDFSQKNITQKTSVGSELELSAGNSTPCDFKMAANRQETVSPLLNQAIRLLSNDRSNDTNQQ